MPNKEPVHVWPPIKEVGLHVFVGVAIFCVIAAAAVGLDLLVHALPDWGVSGWIVTGLTGLEVILFGIDAIFLAVFMGRVAFRTLRALW